MPSYAAPGVYYERVDASTPAISVIRTDIAAFVGLVVTVLAMYSRSYRLLSAEYQKP